MECNHYIQLQIERRMQRERQRERERERPSERAHAPSRLPAVCKRPYKVIPPDQLGGLNHGLKV